MNITLSTSLANCRSAKAFQMLLAGNNIYIVKDWKNPRKMNKTQSNVEFAYHDGEGKAFTVLIDNGCL